MCPISHVNVKDIDDKLTKFKVLYYILSVKPNLDQQHSKWHKYPLLISGK